MFSLAGTRKRTTATGCEMTVRSDYKSHYFDGRRLPGPKTKRKRHRGKHCQPCAQCSDFYTPRVSTETQKGFYRCSMFMLDAAASRYLADILFHDKKKYIVFPNIKVKLHFFSLKLHCGFYSECYSYNIVWYMIFSVAQVMPESPECSVLKPLSFCSDSLC